MTAVGVARRGVARMLREGVLDGPWCPLQAASHLAGWAQREGFGGPAVVLTVSPERCWAFRVQPSMRGRRVMSGLRASGSREDVLAFGERCGVPRDRWVSVPGHPSTLLPVALVMFAYLRGSELEAEQAARFAARSREPLLSPERFGELVAEWGDRPPLAETLGANPAGR